MRPVVDAFSLAVVSELTPVIVAEAPESAEDDSAVSAGARFVIVIVTVTVATCVFPITDEVLFIVDIPSELKLDKPADDTDGEGEETNVELVIAVFPKDVVPVEGEMGTRVDCIFPIALS